MAKLREPGSEFVRATRFKIEPTCLFKGGGKLPPRTGVVVVIPRAVLEPLEGRRNIPLICGFEEKFGPVRQGDVAVERPWPFSELQISPLPEDGR